MARGRLRLSIDSTIAQKKRELSRIQRKLLPAASAKALRDTAFDCRRQIVGRTWGEEITRRNKSLARAAFQVFPDKPNPRKLEAGVYDRLGRRFFQRLATGGTKAPYQSPTLAVPTDSIKRTSSGRTPARLKPQAILQSQKGFLGRTRSGREGIWVSTARKKRARRRRAPDGAAKARPKPKLMYTLWPRVNVPQGFDFYEDCGRVALRMFAPNLDKALAKALVRTR